MTQCYLKYPIVTHYLCYIPRFPLGVDSNTLVVDELVLVAPHLTNPDWSHLLRSEFIAKSLAIGDGSPV